MPHGRLGINGGKNWDSASRDRDFVRSGIPRRLRIEAATMGAARQPLQEEVTVMTPFVASVILFMFRLAGNHNQTILR